MTALLAPPLPYDPAETSLSWANRLAAVHTGQPVQRLLKDMGLSVPAFLTGEASVVGALAAVAGEDPDRVRHGAFRLLKRFNTFRGEDCHRSFASPRVRRFCPLCLRADGSMAAWRHHILWCFAAVGVCPEHGVGLLSVPADLDCIDIREAVDVVGGLGRATASLQDRPIPEYVSWLARRLDGARDDGNWLGTQTIAQVIDASEMMGAVLEHGHHVRVATLESELRHEAIARGFGVMAKGPAAVMAAFDDIRTASTATAVQAGPLAMYGQLFEWLDRRTNFLDPGPVKGLLRDHILRHTAIPRGERLLGEEVTERHLHSIATLSEVTRIPRRRLTRLLQKLGRVPEGISDLESGHIVFPADEVEQLCRDFADAVSLEEVPDHIGASIRQTQALRRAGILTPIVGGKKPGDVRQIVFARRMLDEFLDRLEDLPITDASGTVDIATACQRVGIFTEDLVAGILAGTIPASRIDGRGLDRIRLRLDDVERHRHGLGSDPEYAGAPPDGADTPPA